MKRSAFPFGRARLFLPWAEIFISLLCSADISFWDVWTGTADDASRSSECFDKTLEPDVLTIACDDVKQATILSSVGCGSVPGAKTFILFPCSAYFHCEVCRCGHEDDGLGRCNRQPCGNEGKQAPAPCLALCKRHRRNLQTTVLTAAHETSRQRAF